MYRLFKAERRKLYYSKAFWIIISIVAVLSILNNSSYIFNSSLTGLIGANFVSKTSSAVEKINILNAILGSIDDGFITLVIIFISIFVGTDFNLEIFKNVVSKGFSKGSIYFSKLIASIYAVTIFLLAVIACSLGIGIIFFEKTSISTNSILNFTETILIKILLVFAVVSISVLITTIIRNVGLSIGINLVVLRVLPATIITMIPSLSKYEISSTLYKLESFNTSGKILVSGLIIALAYIIISNAIGIFTFAKRDI